jgi:hypothetical protein
MVCIAGGKPRSTRLPTALNKKPKEKTKSKRRPPQSVELPVELDFFLSFLFLSLFVPRATSSEVKREDQEWRFRLARSSKRFVTDAPFTLFLRFESQ